MTILLAIAILALVALVVYRDLRWEERCTKLELESSRRRAEELAERADLIERAEKERRELYQRIQAPDVAVAEAHRERRGPYTPRRPVGADDDAAYQREKGAGVSGG